MSGSSVEQFSLDYRNRTGRGPGRLVRVLSSVVPGIGRVRAQIEPYADAWHAHNLEVLAKPGRRWFVLGDSLSQGIGASSNRAGWVGQLADLLVARGYEMNIVNLSASGACTRDVIDQQLPLLGMLGKREEDLVTVLIGANDLFGSRERRRRVADSFAELVDAVPIGTVITTLPQRNRVSARANAHVERAAAAGRIVLADLRVMGTPSWRGRVAEDFFHPNDAGYADFAGVLGSTILEVVVRNAQAIATASKSLR